MNDVMKGHAVRTQVYDPTYKETYHVVVVRFEVGHKVAVYDDSGAPMERVPHIVWEVVDRLKQELI